MAKSQPYQLPEEITAATEPLTAEQVAELAGPVEDLDAASTAARERAEEIIALGADATDEQLTELHGLLDFRDALTAEGDRREQAAEERQERLDAAQARLNGEPTDEGDDEDAGDGGGDDDGEEGEGDESESESGDEGDTGDEGDAGDGESGDGDAGAGEGGTQAVAAGGTRRTPARRTAGVAGRMSTRTTRTPKRTSNGSPLSIVAAGSGTGFEGGQQLDINQMVEAFQTRMGGMPGGGETLIPDQWIKQPVATMQRGDAAFTRQVDGRSVVLDATSPEFAGENILKLADIAADERNIPVRPGRKGGSLAAAGGWCAPSENLYDIPAIEKAEGLYSTPEMRVGRGGINFTMGPDFSDIFTDSGFQQTEAQAIAGTEKTCYEIGCADFDEVRLDAIGFCAKAPILTNSAYPELVRRTLAGILVAHQMKVSRYKLAAVQNLLTVTGTVTDVGEFRRSLLTGLELAAEGQRAGFSMGVNDTMEVVLPTWARLALRDDLQARMRQPDPVTDAQLDAHFAARRLNVQFVRGLNDTAVAVKTAVVAFPATLTALMYPAGTFVTGMTDVINLSTVYDTTDLQSNVFTAAFFEEGILVAKRLPTGVKLTIPVKPTGRVGMADLDEPFGTANPAGASQAPAA
jgi:hypothetical protein